MKNVDAPNEIAPRTTPPMANESSETPRKPDFPVADEGASPSFAPGVRWAAAAAERIAVATKRRTDIGDPDNRING